MYLVHKTTLGAKLRIEKSHGYMPQKPNNSHHRFAKRPPTHPALMLPAEANPSAWLC